VIQVMLADAHEVVRQGLKTWLDAEPDLRVVAEASDGLEVVGLVERLRPHVLVLDIKLPGLSGLEVARRVLERQPRAGVVILTMYSSEAYVLEALRVGVLGYVLKSCPPECLLTAVRQAAAGRLYLSPPLTERALEVYAEKARSEPPDLYETLTRRREREVLTLAANGSTSSEIAGKLCISPRTAETHRASGMRKLGLRSQHDLIVFGLKRGLVAMEL